MKLLLSTLAGLLFSLLVPIGAQAQGTSTAGVPSATSSSQLDRRYAYFFAEAVKQQVAGEYAEAFQLFRHCLEMKPTAEVYFALSSYYAEMDDDKRMIQAMEEAARLEPDNDTYLERLGQAYLKANNLDKGIETYERLAANNRHRTDVLGVLGQLYQYKKDYASLVTTIERVEVIDGVSEETALAKMQAYSLQGKKDEELNVLKELVAHHPNDLNYRVMMGNWLMQNERKKEALKEYTAVLKTEPDNVNAQMALLDYYRSENMQQQTDALTRQILLSDKTPMENKTVVMRQFIYDNEMADGDSTLVLRLFDEILQRKQPNADMAELRVAYMSLKHMPKEDINQALHTVLDIAPDNAPARLQLIQLIWGSEKYDEVIDLCRPALAYNPDEMAFYYFLGLAHFQKDENDEALDAFRRGVSQINSESNVDIVSDFYAIMGDIYHQKGMDREAFAAYDSCLHWKPDNIGCLNNYAYYLSLKGENLAKAEQMSYRTIKAQPNSGTYLDTYAWILFKQGRYEEAKIYIDQTLKNDTMPDGTILEHAGDIYALSGDMEQAVTFWRRAVERGGGTALLEEKLKLKKYIEKK